MTTTPTLISRDAARRGCLNHLALLRLGWRLRISEASWTLKTLQSKFLLHGWENQDLESRRDAPGHRAEPRWHLVSPYSPCP